MPVSMGAGASDVEVEVVFDRGFELLLLDADIALGDGGAAVWPGGRGAAGRAGHDHGQGAVHLCRSHHLLVLRCQHIFLE